MASDINLFKELDRTFNSKVRIGNGEFIKVKGRGVVTIQIPLGT